MKEIRRSRRLRLPRRRHQLTKPITSDDDDESDFEHEIFQKKSIGQTNKNANRIATSLFDTIPTLSIEQKLIQSSSDQSSLFLYSINSKQKATTAISDDLTPLTIRTTNTTPLTALTYSNTKQTDLGIVKIDLTELSGTDTLDSSLSNTDHDQSLSLNRKVSLSNKKNEIDDTDTSMKSIVFSKDNSLEQELSYQKHLSCFTIPDVGNGDRMTVVSQISLPITIDTNVNTDQQSSVRWNLQNMTNRFKFIIGCSSLGLIAGIILLVIIL